MKINLILMLALTMTLFGADTNPVVEPQIELTNPSVTLSVSNQTVMVDSEGTNQPARDIIEHPASKEASKYAALWAIGTSILTTLLIGLFKKYQKFFPKDYLVALAPFVGMGIGEVSKLLDGLNLPAWVNFIAGFLSVAIYEAYKNIISKPMKRRRERKYKEAVNNQPKGTP